MTLFVSAPDFVGSPLRRKRAPATLEPVAILPSTKWLTIEQAAERLELSVDDFKLQLLLARIPSPVNGMWSQDSLRLTNRSMDEEKISGIYVIQFMEFIKIGFSDDLLQRICAVQAGLPLGIKVHQLIEGKKRADEAKLHRNFAAYRTRGEWFRFEGVLRFWVEGGCR